MKDAIRRATALFSGRAFLLAIGGPSLWALAILTLPGPIAAAAPIDVQIVATVIQGQERPAVVVIAQQPVRRLRLQLTRSGCAAGHADLQFARLAAGQQHRFDLDQPTGRCDWQGSLEVSFADGASDSPADSPGNLPLQFSTEVAGPPAVIPLPQAFDADTRTVRVTFNRQADHGDVELFGENGAPLGANRDQPLGGAAAGEPLSLAYDPAPAGQPVLRLRVTVTDPGGLFGAVDLYPWSLSIPHAEVNFASGQSVIDASERPKLNESLKQIRSSLAKVGTAPVRLFVAGYTDTVGPSDRNQVLSAARARSIASFFKSAGLQIPVLTAGLGEDALAVATPDETDEPRNRRAEYILAVEAPPIAGASRPPAWAPLP